MENVLITIPDGLKLESIDSTYAKTRNIIGRKQIDFDFQEVQFIRPESLIMLVTMALDIHRQGQQVVHWRNVKREICSYLDRMEINELSFIHLEHPFLYTKRKYNESPVLVELTSVTTPIQLGKAILHTKQILRDSFPEKPHIIHQSLTTLIKETVENSIEHSVDSNNSLSSAGICYYALQKYKHSDGSTEIVIVVADAGVGMLASQRKLYPETKDDVDAIVNCIIHSRTGRLSGKGGMGFANVKAALEPLNGELVIRSGKCHGSYLAQKHSIRVYRHTISFPGTQIVFQCRA